MLLELLLDVVVHADLDLVLHHALHVGLDLHHLSAPRACVLHALWHGLGELRGVRSRMLVGNVKSSKLKIREYPGSSKYDKKAKKDIYLDAQVAPLGHLGTEPLALEHLGPLGSLLLDALRVELVLGVEDVALPEHAGDVAVLRLPMLLLHRQFLLKLGAEVELVVSGALLQSGETACFTNLNFSNAVTMKSNRDFM